MDELDTKLAAARTHLMLDQPFLGALVLRLPMVAADPRWCPTTATDARQFYYNPDYLAALNLAQTQFVLAHEALHCALSHFARRQHRVRNRWDLACDYAINPLLLAEGLTPPPGINVLDEFNGMTAEAIYPLLGDNNTDAPLDQPTDAAPPNPDPPRHTEAADEQDPPPTGAPQPPPLSHEAREALSVQWQQRLAGAAQQAQQAGKLSGTLARFIEALLQPPLPWQALLARYLSLNARDDYSYMRPSRREGAAILPSLRSHQLDVVVALDISGSISDQELATFVAEINALKGQVRARITLLACDAALDPDCPWLYEPWEPCRLPKTFAGGGGTCFTPVFAWIDRADRQPDLLLYFTDAAGEYPIQEPHYPVLWLVKGKKSVPWGVRVQLN